MCKPPESLDAWAALSARLLVLGKVNPDDNARSQRLFQQAIDLDPTFAGGIHRARLGAASSRHGIHYGQFRRNPDLGRSLSPPGGGAGRCASAQALRHHGDDEGALAEAERALTTTPNLASAHGLLTSALPFSGQLRDGLAAVRRSIRLDPRDPGLASRLNYMAIGLYFSREYEAAVEATKRAICSYPEFPLPIAGSQRH
jgi:adenylate cyclase